MHYAQKLLLLPFAVALLMVVLVVAQHLWRQGHDTCVLTLDVSGRLVDVSTRRPIGDAWVISGFSRDALGDPEQRKRIWEAVQSFHDEQAQHRKKGQQRPRVGPLRSGGGVSGPDGRFAFVVSYEFRFPRSASMGRRFFPPPGDDLVRVLWIQIDGREPILIDKFPVEGGYWEKSGNDTGEYVRGALELGTIEVPSDG